ncbi:MAG: hypothetical protein JNK29_19005, partial [Anaerolineales bacterium]|nr:hypothetical protein [Anaerolineales bacterium]
PGSLRHGLGLLLGFGLLAGLLTGAQLLPSLEFVAASTRASVPYTQAAHGFLFQDLGQLLVPGLTSVWSPLYVGLLPLGLAAFALTRRLSEVRFWAGAALVSLVLTFGAQAAAYDAVYWLVPGLALFRGAERLALIVSLALAVLAAFGADAALSALSRPARRQFARLTRAGLALTVVALGLLLLVLATALAGLDWAAAADTLGRWALMAGLTLAVLWVRARVPALRRWTPALFVAVAVVDLFSANRGLNVRPAYAAYPPDPVIAPITAEAGFFRVQDDFRLPGHAGCAYGYSGIEGRTPYQIAGYARLLERAPEAVRWALLGVRHVVTWRADLFDAQGQRIASELAAEGAVPDEKGNPTRTQRLLAEPRRAWLAQSIRVAAGEDLWAGLAAADFDPFATVFLPAPAEAAPNAGPVSVLADVPGRLEFAIQTEAPAVLVVSEPYYAGWRADVDGQPALVLPADGALLAVAVPAASGAGPRAVTLRYQPASLAWGGALSALGLLITGGLLAWPVRGRPGRPGHL